MNTILTELIKFILTISGGVILALFSYEYIEVRKRRRLDTYWKIESEYKSEPQQKARKLIDEVELALKKRAEQLGIDYNARNLDIRLADYYNTAFHESNDPQLRETAWTIRTRLRFLHLCGVLLEKKMIDKDLLFSLVGLGLQIDHPALRIIIAAHRKSHETYHLYAHFEYLWKQYNIWKASQKVVF